MTQLKKAKKKKEVGMAKKNTINAQRVRELAEVFCTPEEIAASLGCSANTIRKKYPKLIKNSYEKARAVIKKKQWEAIKNGNVAMLFTVGKQFLEQGDSNKNNDNEEENVELHKVAHATMVQFAGSGRATSGDTEVQE